MNFQVSCQILESLVLREVTEFCICAGARNAPIIQALDFLSSQYKIKKYLFFHENSAGFFALGRVKATQKPVVVITTSGTAVGQLLTPIMEAHYTQLPLIALTADRPSTYRGSGAPQSVEQMGIFSYYVQKPVDIEGVLPESFSSISFHSGPIHLNLCLDEPLLEERDLNLVNRLVPMPFSSMKSREEEDLTALKERDFSKFKNPLVIVSELSLEKSQIIKSFLIDLGLPVYLEPLSKLKNDKDFQSLSWDHLTSECLLKFDSIIRVGGIPVHRIWRDLEKQKLPVLNFSDVPYSGLSYINEKPLPLVQLRQLPREFCRLNAMKFSQLKSKITNPAYKALLSEHKYSEPWWFNELSKIIPSSSLLFLGNSMPVREWDEFAVRTHFKNVFSNRGVNGIDGLVSTFLGLSLSYEESWCVLGDYSTLYDLSGFWLLKSMPEIFKNKKIRFIVINNQGGKIFNQVFSCQNLSEEAQDMLTQPHSCSFIDFVKPWGWSYKKLCQVEELLDLENHQFLEIQPEEFTTNDFWVSLRGST